MTNKASNELPQISEAVTNSEEGYDDVDYAPGFIKKYLDNPELLPRYISEDFLSVFEDFESTHCGRAKTTFEYILVSEATKIVLSLHHLDRLRGVTLVNQQRPAVESLFRKTHEGAALKNADGAIHAEAILNATRYFADPAFKAMADKKFEAAGYAPDALEGEAYLRAQSSLVMIQREQASNRKALFSILKDLELRYASRHPEESMVVEKTASKSSKAKAG